MRYKSGGGVCRSIQVCSICVIAHASFLKAPIKLLNLINEFDYDGNGKIDFGEFCKMMKEMNKETDQELIRLAFK